ncbi:MAG: hypothetical protein K2G26_03765 [Clostridia bacterium]|nr:hypothetical protein [Clostridia bacterium]
MAKRRTTTTTSSSNYSLVKVCAFWGVVLAGVAGLISFVFSILEKCGVIVTWGSKVSGACSFIAQIALFISAWLAAWDYVKYKSKGWRVVFWVFFVLGILGLVGLGIASWF